MKEETLRQKQIFDIYYSLGEKRSLEKLREYLKNTPEYTNNTPSLDTLKSWSKKFNWQERIQQRDFELNKELEKKTRDEILDIKANYRKIIRAVLSELAKGIKDFQEKSKRIQIENIRDFKEISQMMDLLIKLDMNLIGEKIEEPIQIIISKELLPQDDD